LALTFIDTLLSSQRTRTHHHHDPMAAAPGQLFQPIPTWSPAQTAEHSGKNWRWSTTIHDGNYFEIWSGTSYNLVSLAVKAGVGVRVALTWNKLRVRRSLW